MIADQLSACTDPGKMTVRAKGEDTITCRATVTLQKKTGRKVTEITMDISVAPETIMAAAGTNSWSFPRIIFAKLKNILEQSGNKIYHQNTLLWG
jgi:hypothetical protein